MFDLRLPALLALLAALVAVAFSNGARSSGAASETRHTVAPGETLWTIAAARYGGDPRAGVWRIQERNGVEAGALQPGMVLYLPP
jgi:nucleoid-associated protein YgaU